MDYDPNKRLRTASGAPLSTTNNSSFQAANHAAAAASASLPSYTPPPPPPSGAIHVSKSSGPAQPLASVTGHGSNKLRLTVKAQPSRLRQATSGSALPPVSYAEASESDTTPAPPTRTARSTRNPRTVVEPDSDDLEEDEEEEEEEPEEDEDEEDAEGEIDDTTMGPEASDGGDEDEDEEMEDMSEHPPPPVITQTRINGKPNVTVTAPPEGPLKSVEAKEMEDEDDDDDDELSELESEGDGNENDNDDENDDEEGDDSDDENGSRSATPDLSKLTRRQRGFYEESEDPNLMALSNEAQKKKHLTVEEHAMRRQEMAKRRKNLSEKRNEEEKMDTINKLLSKPAPKRRTRAEIIAQERADGLTPGAEEGDVERPDALSIRWVNSRAGSRIGVPEEWLEKPVGEVFQAQIMAVRAGGRVQEVS